MLASSAISRLPPQFSDSRRPEHHDHIFDPNRLVTAPARWKHQHKYRSAMPDGLTTQRMGLAACARRLVRQRTMAALAPGAFSYEKFRPHTAPPSSALASASTRGEGRAPLPMPVDDPIRLNVPPHNFSQSADAVRRQMLWDVQVHSCARARARSCVCVSY